VQLQVEIGASSVLELGEFRLELSYAAAQPRYFRSEYLLVASADVSQQGACHLVVLH
jgi:hypothetical protein